jgi:fumarylacetoacetate (FAA) hydrolase family protein
MSAQDWTGGVDAALPDDRYAGTLAGRVCDPAVEGPSVVALREDGVYDVSERFATMRDVFETEDPAAELGLVAGRRLGSLADILANTAAETRDPSVAWLLSPVEIAGRIGSELRALVPGSPEAARMQEYFLEQGLWSQYLEVGIGPDAEIFTKAPVLASVGTGVEVGLHSSSTWNNPEPEVVLAIASNGRIVGAALGNDVNLRDIEGRSALLLPKAKDNNASASLGPFVRFFDATFSLEDVRSTTVELEITGEDGFRLEATSPLSEISRDPEDLAAQLLGPHHQYPDGAVLYLGTLFAPIVDRDEPGRGFTHKVGDVVRISAPLLGGLVNRVQISERCEPWTFGISALMRNLARRSLL